MSIYYRTNELHDAYRVRDSRADMRPDDGPWRVWLVTWAPNETEAIVTHGIDTFPDVMALVGMDDPYSICCTA